MERESRLVKRLEDFDREELTALLSKLGLRLAETPSGARIPGSYWGEPEAGLLGDEIHARPDTPIHSLLHEASHYLCMTGKRRAHLERDAGGDDAEESAVCCLQILLADYLSGMGRARMFRDMDEWGYSFRLGSSEAWFESDSEDARAWLFDHGLIDESGAPLWRVRDLSCDNE